MDMTKKKSGRGEVWMRIPVLIISGIILSVWKWLIYLFILINFVYGIFSGKKIKEISNLSGIWNIQVYYFLRYITFVANERPFPFEKLKKI